MKKHILINILTALFLQAFLLAPLYAELSPIEKLGKSIFFDTDLSNGYPRQSCAVCHGPAVGWTGPESRINAGGAVYPGAVHVRFGNRKPPTSAYCGDSPILNFDGAKWVGGMFWDGRATGDRLGDPLAEQALGPFLNPLEQNMPSARLVIIRIAHSEYAELFEEVWGPGSLDFVRDVSGTYDKVGRSIAAYERSSEVSAFTSKYDAVAKGNAQFTAQEARGRDLFEGKANCANCHPAPLFTDFTYDNLGIPKNPKNPFYTMPKKYNPLGKNWIDYGLGDFLKSAGYPASVYEPELGKHKVPTIRNVDLRPSPSFIKAFGHNGYFKSLEEIVHFYNTRDTEPWPPSEVPENINSDEMGNLGLTPAEEADILAFLKTLNDGFIVQ